MASSSEEPPAQRDTFDSQEDEIEYLAKQLVYWFWRPKRRRAKAYAERLASLLGDPTPERVMEYSEHWISIWEARGNTQEAIRIANATLDGDKAELEDAASEHRHKNWFAEDARCLQVGLFLQADRHLRLGDRARARQRMLEAKELADKYGVEMDAQERTLLTDLLSSSDDLSGPSVEGPGAPPGSD
jgi:hypothetical protein